MMPEKWTVVITYTLPGATKSKQGASAVWKKSKAPDEGFHQQKEAARHHQPNDGYVIRG